MERGEVGVTGVRLVLDDAGGLVEPERRVVGAPKAGKMLLSNHEDCDNRVLKSMGLDIVNIGEVLLEFFKFVTD